MSKPLGPFGRLAAWVLAHRPAVALATVALTVLALIGSAQLDVDSNLLALLPEDEPSSAALIKLHREEGGANLVTLAFEAEDPAAFDPVLDELTSRLSKLESVQFAIHEIDPDLAFRLGLLQLQPSEIEELTVRLKGALALGPALNPIVLQRLMAMGPLTEKIGRAGHVQLLGGDENTARILVRPTGSSTDPVFSKNLMDAIDRELDASDLAAKGIRVKWKGGAYRHNVEDREGIWQDIKRTGVASLITVLACVIIAFRSVRATVLLYVPILVASAINLAVTWILFGTINTYTSFGTAILLGLGIDYGSHLVARYREFRTTGLGIEEAIARAWDKTGPPAVTSCLTSVAGFLALATAQFQGFSQLGVVLAFGLVISLGVALILVPVLIPWLDAHPPLLLGASHRTSGRPATYKLAPIGLMLAVVATGLAGTRLWYLEWEYDISALRRDGLAYDELSPEERALARESYSPVLATYPTADDLTREHHRIQGLIDEGKLPRVARIVSVETVLPSDQDARVAGLAELAKLLEHPNLRYLPPPLVKNLIRLRGFDARPLTRDDLPRALLTLLGAGTNDQHRLLLFPKGNMWDIREASAFADELHAAFPGQMLAGEFLAMGALYRVVVSDMPRIAVLALFLVAALTLIDLRRFHWFAGAFGTLIAGLVWAGVAIEQMGVKMSILNVVGLPILVGIGVDVCIHLLHRLREEGPGGVRRALQTTGVAAVVATATTVVSFFSLLLAGNRGIRSLGLLVGVGLTLVFFASATFLPLAWAAGWRVTGRAPGDTRPRRVRGRLTSGPSEARSPLPEPGGPEEG